jgi:hypothetical protein
MGCIPQATGSFEIEAFNALQKLTRSQQFWQSRQSKRCIEKLNLQAMKFLWIYTLIGISCIEMGLGENLVAMESRAYRRPKFD